MAQRRYDGTNREEAARLTRAKIISAARAILVDDQRGGAAGYRGMTVARLAEAAGVSPQTVYNSIGGKAEVVKAVYDVMLAGDDEPIPMSERPEFLAMRSSADPDRFFAAYAHISRLIYERVGPLLGVLLEGGAGAGGDELIREFVATIDKERRIGNGHALDRLETIAEIGSAPGRERLHDAIWTLTSPEVADRLVRRRGWPLDDYESWLHRQLLAAYDG